jgi:replicative DNA helicase
VEERVMNGHTARFRPLPTGFIPLDDVLGGGIRPGELLVIGGPYGVGKTIFALQIARNVVHNDPNTRAIYVCYEHDRTHLMSRLICLESAEQPGREQSLTLRKLAQLTFSGVEKLGLISQLRHDARYRKLLRALDRYGDRLVLAKASGVHSTLQEIEAWVKASMTPETQRLLLVVDYLQKIPVDRELRRTEDEVTTYLTHGLKELALSLGVQVIAIAASDRLGLRAKRMRLADLRGSSALQYEADVGLMLNNKHDIVSREHLVYNLSQAGAMRNWIVISVEKNRAGFHAVDMEHAIDAPHFRITPHGDFVRERLLDEKVVLK